MQSLDLQPAIIAIHEANEATKLVNAGRFVEAAELYVKAFNKCGNQPKLRAGLCNNIGHMYFKLGDKDAAEKWFLEGLNHWNRHALLWVNLANFAQWRHDKETALRYANKALMIDPTCDDARFSKAITLLASGDLADGFKAYECRHHRAGVRRPATNAPQWLGQDIAGKHLLVAFEQGMGDTLQMLRYGPFLRLLGIVPHLVCQRGIGPIAAKQGCWESITEVRVIEELGRTAKAPPHDLWCFTMSLPLLCVPPHRGNAYLEPRWKSPGNARKRIGIVWAGSPDHAHDKWRSTNLDDWQPLLSMPFDFVSLQVGPRSLDLIQADPFMSPFPQIEDASPRLKTFEDTARELLKCDALVSVDTSTVHLAGAIGCPVSLMVATSPDWRWTWSGERSYWYDSVRIFRQEKPLEWKPVIERVAQSLA